MELPVIKQAINQDLELTGVHPAASMNFSRYSLDGGLW